MWRLHTVGFSYSHPDEAIAVRVGKALGMSLDTNWAHVEMPGYLPPGNQYNFSAHIIASTALLKLAEISSGTSLDDGQRLAALRAISLSLGILLVGLTAALAWRLGADPVAALAAAALVALSPQLFMDSLYARPEVFVSCLSIAFVFAALSPNQNINRIVAGLICGVLFATKVTFIVLVPFLYWAVLTSSPSHFSLRASLKDAFKICCSFLVGAFVGMPQAFLHPADYIDGVRFLSNHYATSHWPHGLGASASLLARFEYGITWVAQTWGVLPVLLASLGVAVLYFTGNRRAAILIAPFLLTFLYFCSSPVFFERNFSQSLVVIAALFAVGITYLMKRFASRLGSIPTNILVALVFLVSLWGPLQIGGTVFKALQSAGSRESEIVALRNRIRSEFSPEISAGRMEDPPKYLQ